jgi:predicted metal-dependent hydrolase
MKVATLDSINLGGRRLDFRLVHSPAAQKLRLRIGLAGVEVVLPGKRTVEDVKTFLFSHKEWISNQLERIDQFRSVRKPQRRGYSEILYRGVPTQVQVEDIARRQRTNQVIFEQGCLVIIGGRASRISLAKSLENWLRRQAREEIQRHLEAVTRRLKQFPRKVYVMDQRTKWGNCSARQNLSFNRRLIMAPEFVVHYLVTHETVHLAIPDHSKQFWLTVQSLCPETERAKQWLCAHSYRMFLDLHELFVEPSQIRENRNHRVG